MVLRSWGGEWAEGGRGFDKEKEASLCPYPAIIDFHDTDDDDGD